jgi:hypothetical protein
VTLASPRDGVMYGFIFQTEGELNEWVQKVQETKYDHAHDSMPRGGVFDCNNHCYRCCRRGLGGQDMNG